MPIDIENPRLRVEVERPRAGSHFDSRRRAEFEGFLLSTAGALVLLSLISYHSLDPSLDTSASTLSAVHNWIGRVGAYLADGLLQGLGWTAYLAPLVLLVVGVRRMFLRPFAAPRTKAVGVVLLAASLAALLDLAAVTPPVAGLIRSGGVAGYLLGAALVEGLNPIGAAIVAGAVFLASLFLVTRFSFATLGRFLQAQFAPLAGARDSWRAWQESRERQRLKKRLEQERKTGKAPVGAEKLGRRPRLTPGLKIAPEPHIQRRVPRSPVDEDEADGPGPVLNGLPDPRVASGEGLGLTRPAIAPSLGAARRAPAAPAKAGRAAHKYKLPSATLLRPPAEEQGIDEDELKERAARLIEKFVEFGVTGSVTQIHPGPVVTTFEFKPEAGIKYSRITNLVDDLCLAMKAESILIDRIPGKSTVGIEVPNLHREVIYLRELVEAPILRARPQG